ncbi:MAG TPA: aminoacyl-tRNA hydrolase [Patescibacteria group bacterium]
MILIVGLGNPGKKYENNRHNVGYMFIDYLVDKLTGLRVNELKIVKTDCFMNQSGKFVKKLVSKLANSQTRQINNLIIIHDDLDIPLGKFHIQFGVGPQLHNGLESIENHLKTKDFYRIRIGVDNREQINETRPERSRRIPGETYTLQNFFPEEKKLLETEIFPKIFSQLKLNLKCYNLQKYG